MHPLHDYVAKQLADKPKSRKLVVWYDARGEFEPFIAEVRGGARGSSEPMPVSVAGIGTRRKDAIKRASELEQALTEPRLRDLERARQATAVAWPFLQQESDISEDLRTKARALDDLLARETFFRELPTIEQYATAIESEYERRYQDALDARIAAYKKAFDRLIMTPGWPEIDED